MTICDQTSEFSQDGRWFMPLFSTGIPQRFPSAAVINAQLLKYGQGFRIFDHPFGNGSLKIAGSHGFGVSLRNEWPVFSPATKTTSATAPRKNTVSPGTRIQRKVCMIGVCMNSLLRAYQ